MKTLIKLAKSNRYTPTLHSIRVKGGIATASDLYVFISTPLDKPDGLYSPDAAAAGIYQDIGLPLSDYPDTPDIGTVKHAVGVAYDDLAWVALAQSFEETRYYINCVLFDKAGIVATDGHRLHKVDQAADMGDDKYLLPRPTVKIILALHKEQKLKTPVTVEFTDAYKFRCIVGAYTVTGRLVDGTFPDYGRVIPRHNDGRTVYRHAEFKAVAKEVAALAKANGQRRRNLKFSDGKMTVMAGEFSKSWDSCMQFGELEVGFNFDFLDYVGMAQGEVHYDDSRGPIKIVAGNRTAVIMPVRV